MQIRTREAPVFVILAERENETAHFLCRVAKKREEQGTPMKLLC